MELRETIRQWLIDTSLGLIDAAELTVLADQAIVEFDAPPDFLIAVSLGEPLTGVPRLDLVAEPLALADLRALATRLITGLESDTLDLEVVAVAAARLSFPRSDALADAWAQFAWISDEKDLIDQGVKEATGYRENVFAALRQVAAWPDA